MTAIAHISDSHFGTVDERVRVALLEDLRTHSPNVVLLSGDITQRARRYQFGEAKAFIDALPAVPRLAIPGNHDIPLFDVLTRFTHPYRLYRRYISSELEPSYLDDEVVLLCLNSTRATRHKNGEISARQIERTAKRLSEARQPFRVVVLHHPLAVTLGQDETNRVAGADQALESWIAAGADLFLGGHIHLPYCVPVYSKRTGRAAVVLQAGTAISQRVRHGVPNSYNWIILESHPHPNPPPEGEGIARRMRLERRDYDAATQRFHVGDVHEAVATHNGWSLTEFT